MRENSESSNRFSLFKLILTSSVLETKLKVKNFLLHVYSINYLIYQLFQSNWFVFKLFFRLIFSVFLFKKIIFISLFFNYLSLLFFYLIFYVIIHTPNFAFMCIHFSVSATKCPLYFTATNFIFLCMVIYYKNINFTSILECYQI